MPDLVPVPRDVLDALLNCYEYAQDMQGIREDEEALIDDWIAAGDDENAEQQEPHLSD